MSLLPPDVLLKFPILNTKKSIPRKVCHRVLMKSHYSLRCFLDVHQILPFLNKKGLITAHDQFFLADPVNSPEVKVDLILASLPQSPQKDYLTPFAECLFESYEYISGLPNHYELLEKINALWCKETNAKAIPLADAEYQSGYHHFISTKDSIELLFLKVLFLGPPRLGKTTTRRRIMGLIIDLLSAGEADEVHPSTGAVECGHKVLVHSKTDTNDQTQWTVVKNILDEALMLFRLCEKRRNEGIRVDDNSSSIGVPQQTQTANFLKKLLSKLKNRSQNSTSQPKQIDDISEVASILKLLKLNSAVLEDTHFSLLAYLHFEDTGGQLELMDMLPALTIGPGLYLLFFSYELNLKSEFNVFYQRATGETSVPEKSVITLEEMLLSSISSISCSNACSNLLSTEEAVNPDMSEILESSKSIAYLVGTHKDKVSEQDVASFDEELKKIIVENDSKVVQFCSEGKLAISLDNLRGGSEEVNEIRRLLEKAFRKHFKKLKIPIVWLLFSVCLRSKDIRKASMETCLQLSKSFEMSSCETKIALWFLHHNAGVLMYFPDVPGLEDLVIIDNQIIFDSVTSLILKSMTFENVGEVSAKKFRQTGQFLLNDLIAATAHIPGDFIPPYQLLSLLEYLHIVAQISLDNEDHASDEARDVVYMMPCVLLHANNDRLDSVSEDRSRPCFIAPLIVRYKSGYVPTGVFPALVASLIGNTSFSLVQEGRMYKNLVQFRYGPLHTLVTFISRPKFYEVIISELPVVQHEPHVECVAIRKEVEAMFEKVSSRMNYGYFMDYQFGFECPTHPGKQHLCVVDSLEIMLCLKVLTNKKPIPMEDCHKIWFGKPFNPVSVPEAAVASPLQTEDIEKDSISSGSQSSAVSIFTESFPKLVEAVKFNVSSIADHCLGKQLISIETYESIIERDLTATNKARIVLSDIRQAISRDEASLHLFISVLSEIPGYDTLAEELKRRIA